MSCHCHDHENKHEHEHEHEHDEHGHCHEHGHEHGHSHGHEEGEEENRGLMIARLIIAALLIIAGLFFPEDSLPRILLSAAGALVIGYDVLIGAVRNLIHGELLDELFLMSVACIGAFILGECTDGSLVLLLFQLGEFLQDMAEDRSRRSIADLMDLRPDSATLLKDGKEETVSPDAVQPGDTILIKPGERIPLDGIVLDGESFLDTVALTGESVPRSVRVGEEVLSGCVNLRGALKIKVLRPFGESTVSRILDLVEDASDSKSSADRFITRFARIYTPVVVISALVLFLIGGLVTGNWAEWLRRAITFLVISCPCALVISVPLSYFNGIGRASKNGVLVKGAHVLEQLSRTSLMAFDKTGTVTKGVFEVTAVHPRQFSGEQLLLYAAGAEKYSTHPIADSIRDGVPGWDTLTVEQVEEIAGRGVLATVDGHRVAAGNSKLMDQIGAEWKDCHHKGTIVHVAVDGVYEGHLVISDIVRENAADAIRDLKAAGIRKTVMLTGDRKDSAAHIGALVGVDEIYGELSPEDKVRHVADLQKEKNPGETLVFVGDGINDAPVLAASDIGVAMGGAGSDAAVEAADVVLIHDDPSRLPYVLRLARSTQHKVIQNIVFSILVKVAVMILGAFGVVPLWLAVFSDVGVCILAILNALR